MHGIDSDRNADTFERCLRLLETLDHRTKHMALDLTALTAQEKRLVSAVDKLLVLVSALQAQITASGGNTDPAVQAAIDAITSDLSGEAVKVEAVEDAAGSTGTTGATGTSQ